MVPPPPKKDKSQVNMSSAPTSPNPLVRTQTTSSISSTLSTDSAGGTRPAGGRLAREKNRLTLRAYLRVLLASGALASSPVLQSFLLAEPTTLGADELADARRREEADRLRDEGRRRFARELAARVDGLRGALRSVKGDMMGQGASCTRPARALCSCTHMRGRRPHTHFLHNQGYDGRAAVAI
jgi:hypothetical protein